MSVSGTTRGGWFPIVLTALGPTLAALMYVHGPQSTGVVQVIYFISKITLFSFPIVWWLLVEKKRAGQAASPRGLKLAAPWDTHRVDIGIGILSGLVIGLSIWGVYWFVFRKAIDVGALEEKIRQFGAYDYFVAYAVFLAVVNSGLEEYYWRWFVFGRLKIKIGLPAAMILSGLAFASHHFVVLQDFLKSTQQAALFSLGIAAGGAIWAYHTHRTGRLWGVWVSHFLVDAAALSVGYHLLF